MLGGKSGEVGSWISMAAVATAAYERGSVRVLPDLVDCMLDLMRCWWPLIVAIELGAYFVICFVVNSGQLDKNAFLTAFVHVDIVGENNAA